MVNRVVLASFDISAELTSCSWPAMVVFLCAILVALDYSNCPMVGSRMQKSKIKVQNCGFGPWPKLFYAKESIDISLFNEKDNVTQTDRI